MLSTDGMIECMCPCMLLAADSSVCTHWVNVLL